jgi:hypothetical protein
MSSKEADTYAMQILTEEDDDYSDQFATPIRNKGGGTDRVVKLDHRGKRLSTEPDESEEGNLKPNKVKSQKKDPSNINFVTPTGQE